MNEILHAQKYFNLNRFAGNIFKTVLTPSDKKSLNLQELCPGTFASHHILTY